jgi:hypothetical protein
MQAAFQHARPPPAKQAGKLQGLRTGVKSASSWLEDPLWDNLSFFPITKTRDGAGTSKGNSLVL